MCGIAGLLLPDAEPGRWPEAVRAVGAMCTLLRHRGPDDDGMFGGDGVVLGHRRLSILDLSARGHQPMRLPGTPYWIVHNGEVYNYRELRAELEGGGARFGTETDTEVILAAYAQWGPACVERFNGMFAFAIWDERARTLFCARDRFGIKPFLYTRLPDGTLAFASELKAFHALPNFSMRVNEDVAALYIGQGLVDASDATFVEDVVSLPAGHRMLVTPGERPRAERYWRLEPEAGLARRARQRLLDGFRAALTDSVRLRLRSDVPLGTCFSGGLDSSTIVAVVHGLLHDRETAPRQATFSACFEDPAVDERPFMRALSAVTRTEPHEVYPTAAQLDTELDDLVWHQDEPFGSTSIFAQRCVFRRAKSAGVTVTLDGQGADEVLGGYDHYAPTYFAQLAVQGRPFYRLEEAWRYARLRGMPTRRVLRRARRRWARRNGLRGPAEYVHPRLLQRAAMPSPLAGFDAGRGDLLRHHMRGELERTLLPSLLRYADRNSMTFGVEARVPFLDHRAVAYAYGLPVELLMGRGWTKRVVREAFGDILPGTIAWRRDKIGFAPPESRWFREAMSARFRALLADRSADVFARFVDYDATAAAWRRFERGGPYRTHFWRTLNLHLWLTGFLTPAAERLPRG